MSRPTLTILAGNPAAATLTQLFQVWNDKGESSTGRVTVVCEVAEGRLLRPVMVSCYDIPDDARCMVDDWGRTTLGLSGADSLFPKLKCGNPLAKSMTREQKIGAIVDVTSWAMAYQRGETESCPSFVNGVIEGAGHAAACALVQWFDLKEGVGTMETVEALELEQFPDAARLRVLVTAYLSEIEKHEGHRPTY